MSREESLINIEQIMNKTLEECLTLRPFKKLESSIRQIMMLELKRNKEHPKTEKELYNFLLNVLLKVVVSDNWQKAKDKDNISNEELHLIIRKLLHFLKLNIIN